MAYIIAVANQKGGVAKTTTVISLGGALAQLGSDVLLIDLDAQADLTLGLGINPAQVRGSISDVLLNTNSLQSARRETSIPGLDLVPSNHDMELAERFLPIRQNYETLFRGILNTHLPPHAYDYILLDCPPSLGAVPMITKVTSNLVIIPTQPEYYSAHALRNVVLTIRRVRSQFNPNLQFRLLITMHDRRIRTHRTLSEQLRTTFGTGVLETVIDVDTKLRESTIAGLPITHFISKTRGSLQYQALAQELTQYVKENVNRPQPNKA